MKYENKLNPGHFSQHSVLSFKDKYQNKYKDKLTQTHTQLSD
jgi:hypothetical protein